MSVVRQITPLLLSVSFLMMGHGLIGTLLPLRGLAEGFSSSVLGVLGALYFLGFGVGTVLGPHVIRRVGHIRVFTAMAATICIAVIAQALLAVPLFWWVTRALTGVCLASLYIVIESWLNATSTQQNRGMIFSIYTVISLGVITAGQFMVTVSEVTGFALFAVATMLFAASAIPVSLTRTLAPVPAHTVRLRLRYLWGLSPVAVFGAMAVGCANGAFWTLGPVFAQRVTQEVSLVAVFMSITVFAGAVGQLPFGWLSDRIDRRIVIILVGTGAAIAAGGHVMAARYWQLGIYPCAVIFGLFALPLYALCAAHLNDKVEDDGYVEAASGLLLLYSAGAVVGPLVASVLMDHYGPDLLFLFTSAVHTALVVYAVGRICWRKSPVPADKTVFTDLLVCTGTVANLDPAPMDTVPAPNTENAMTAPSEDMA